MPTRPLPEIKKDCSSCHALDEKGTPRSLKLPLSGLCIGCHQDRAAPSDHVVDVVPSREVNGLPLSEGKMTCATCHDPHANRFGALLRMKQADLCLHCHPV